MYKDKRGISNIVTILIIIALVLVAIGIVWVVVQNVLSQGQIETEQAMGDLFDKCPTANVTDQDDTGGVCGASEEVRTIGGEYCCI